MRIFIAVITVVILLGAGFIFSPYSPVRVSDVQKFVSADKSKQNPEKVFNAIRTTLENGLEIVVIPNHRAPVVTHMVWYKVGAADEKTGRSGIAHFMEHLMFKGSPVIGEAPLAPGEFSKIIRSLGGNDNAFTGQDYTAYFQSIAADQLERVMKMEAGRMVQMNLTEDEVLSERDVILEERRQRTDNDPRARFGEQMTAAAFVNHPYGTPVLGWKHEMEMLTLDYAQDFHKKWYAPNNAILVIAGDVDVRRVLALAQQTYGTIPARDIPVRERTQSPAFNSETRVNLRHSSIHQPAVQILYRVPSRRQNPDIAHSLEVLEEIMAGGPTSRIYKSLVVDQKIAINAGISYSADAWDDAQFWLYAYPVPGIEPDVVENALYDEFRKLITGGVTATELSGAIARMQDSAIYARDSLTGPAMTIGRALASGSKLDDVEYWPARIESVTKQRVQAAAQSYLNPDYPIDTPPVVGVLMPEEKQGGE